MKTLPYKILSKMRMHFPLRFVITIFAFMLLLGNITNIISAQQSSSNRLELLWVKYGQEGRAYATCVSGSTVYVIGYSETKGRIEARDMNTGELIYSWERTYGSITILYDCIVMNDYLYVIGGDNAPGNWEWLILKFTLDLKLVSVRQYNPSDKTDVAYTVTTDGRYLYVGGYDSSRASIWDLYTNTQWHLIKMDTRDLSVLKSYTSNPSGGTDNIYSIGINPLDGKIWLVGSVNEQIPLSFGGRIEVLDQDFSLIGVKDLGYQATYPQVVFDELGYAYIVSPSTRIIDGGLLKISPDLNIVKTNSDIKAEKILYSNEYLYLARNVYKDGYWRHAVMRVTKDLNVVEELTLSSLVNADSYFSYIGKMAIASNKLFVTGFDYATGKSRWVIYSVGIAPLLSSVTFKIMNIPGTTLPPSGGTFTVIFYDAKWNYVTSNEVRYQGGETSAVLEVSLPYGEYNIEVYHKSSDTKIDREMWGQYRIVLNREQLSVELQRFFSVVKQFSYSTQGNNIAVNALLFYPGLATPPWDSQPYFISIILDDDLKLPYIKAVNSTMKTLKSGETYSYSTQFTKVSSGIYYLLVISYWHNPWTEKNIITDIQYKVIILDTTPPTTTHNYDGLWHTSDITIVLKASDDLSGVAETFYRINGGPVKRVSVDGHPVISTEGANNTLEYWSVDNAGNVEPRKILTGIKLDKTPPTGSITINEGRKYTNTTTVILTLLASDEVSGVAEMRFSNDNITWTSWEPYSSTRTWILKPGDGLKYVYVQFRDHAGLISRTYYSTITLDTTPPTTTHNYDGLWHTSDITIVLKASDDLSGVAETFYRINGGPVKRVSVDGHPVISTEGANNTLEYWSVDNAGNVEPRKILTNIKLDKTPPLINIMGFQTRDSELTISWIGSDDLSGIDHYEIRLDEREWINMGVNTSYTFKDLAPGIHIIHIKAADRAGNINTTSIQLTITTVTQTTTIPTTTTTTVTSTTMTQSTAVTQTATVTQTKVETYTTVTQTQSTATETAWMYTIVLVVILLLVGMLIGYAIKRRK
jgi:hypothetical protein